MAIKFIDWDLKSRLHKLKRLFCVFSSHFKIGNRSFSYQRVGFLESIIKQR